MSGNPGRDRALEEFEKPGPLPDGANLPDAEARLLGALERELGVRLDAPPVRRPRGLRSPRFLAFAATLVATAGLLWSLGTLDQEREQPVLRGPAASNGAWNAQPLATPLDGGRTALAWSGAPRATGYRVTFLGEDLNELARVEDLDSTTLVLEPGRLPAGLAPGQAVLWRVTALDGRDEIARSRTSSLLVP